MEIFKWKNEYEAKTTQTQDSDMDFNLQKFWKSSFQTIIYRRLIFSFF